jgi:hypothetical protein
MGSREVAEVPLPLQDDFPMDAVEKRLLSVKRKCVLFRLCFLPKFLERWWKTVFLSCCTFLVAFYRE